MGAEGGKRLKILDEFQLWGRWGSVGFFRTHGGSDILEHLLPSHQPFPQIRAPSFSTSSRPPAAQHLVGNWRAYPDALSGGPGQCVNWLHLCPAPALSD